jgi:hypothetical protein
MWFQPDGVAVLWVLGESVGVVGYCAREFSLLIGRIGRIGLLEITAVVGKRASMGLPWGADVSR